MKIIEELINRSFRMLYYQGVRQLVKRIYDYTQKEIRWFLQRKSLYERSKNGIFLTEVINNKMFIDLNDTGLSKELIMNGKREIIQTEFLKDILRKGMKVLDIGANIGYFALIEAECVGNKGKVYVIEPIPKSFELLLRNVRINNYKNCELFNMAFSNKKGESYIYQSERLNWSSMKPNKYRDMQNKIKVKVDTVDNFLREKEKPDLIRMDVEGHELEVFEGMEETLNSINHLILFLELHPIHLKVKIPELKNLIHKLIRLGYEPIKLTDTMGFKDFKIDKAKFAEQVCKLDAPGVFFGK